MSVQEDAPYHDKISEDGKTIDYACHNLNKRYCNGKDPNTLEQPLFLPSRKLIEKKSLLK